MSPRRRTTTPPIAQPVRFYKLIALSFLFLTIALLGIILFMSSKRATIVITTKEDPVDVESTVMIGTNDGDVDGMIASSTVRLTKSFSPTGEKKIEGVAGGIVILHNESNISQPLVATTRLQTADGTLFRLKKRATVPANGTVEAEVYADKKGESGNIDAVDRFTIPGLRKEKQKFIYGSSKHAMTGGVRTVGVLSQSDVDAAEKKLLAEIEELAKEKLQKKFGEKRAVYEVFEKSTKTIGDIGKEVSEFEISGVATVLGVAYDAQQVQKLASQKLMKRVIDDVTILREGEGAATVSLRRYDLDAGTAELAVFYNGVQRLNSESKQLQKLLFFGKSKEEVRRHVLTLDHVYSVDVKFRPVWVRTVPFVPDHVQVIVKTVQ